MNLDVTQALRMAGETFEMHCEEMLSPQSYSDRQVVPVGSAVLHAHYVFDGKMISLSGMLQVDLSEVCARCNDNYLLSLQIPIEEHFQRGSAEEDMYSFQGGSLDLTQMVWDNIYLNLPIAGLCKEDCRGLCPDCGCNLNITQCNCATEKSMI